MGLEVVAPGISGGGFIRRRSGHGPLRPAHSRASGRGGRHRGRGHAGHPTVRDAGLRAARRAACDVPGVQIGFGFALTGVGGLLALNRRVNVDVLRSRLAAGTAGRILAPQDPIGNAPSLLADLDAVFPAAPGVTVVGPTVQLIWADLVHLDVGVFIELPGRRGSCCSVRPTRRSAGRSDLSEHPRRHPRRASTFGPRTAAFDAVLVDSHLLGTLDLTGGAAFRLSWGRQPYAVLSLGGFHPAYNPEPLTFPASLTRIAMVHGTPNDEVYLRFEGYFAITSNTLQFGASVEARCSRAGSRCTARSPSTR